jgi:hypothetical protein
MVKEALQTTICIAFCLAFVLWFSWPDYNQHMTVRYDCSIAEISPDYPVAVKEACRKRISK